MLKMIKEAQQIDETTMLIVEKCTELNVPTTLLENLGGTMLSYVQMLKAGRGLSPDLAANLANLFAFAELIGAIRNETSIKPQIASDLLNVYRGVKPGQSDASYQQVMDTVDSMGPATQQAFRNLANKWGKEFSTAIQSKSPEAINALANHIVRVADRVQSAVHRLQWAHDNKTTKQWRARPYIPT